MTGSLYEQDFYAWIHHHIKLLKQRKFAEIEVEILIDELESMAKRDRRELISHLVILILHLLKWQFQPLHRSHSWRSSIVEQRYQIHSQLEESPSLRAYLSEAMLKAYPKAVELASKESGLPASTFPEDCPYSLEQLLNDEFYME